MAKLVFLVLAMTAALTNGFVISQEDPQLYYLTGLDGGVLTAHPGPEGDGHAYPAAGFVLNEQLVEGNKAQQWAIYESFQDFKSLISQENSWNEVYVYFIHPDSFPVTNDWLIEESGTEGVVYLASTFILDDKKSYIQNNGPNERITFGPLDTTPGSSSEWKIVPIVPTATKN